jgi:tetratricopeptide (TPR) repeat protein
MVGACALAISCGSSTKGADEPGGGSGTAGAATDTATNGDTTDTSTSDSTAGDGETKSDNRVAMAPTGDAGKAKLPHNKKVADSGDAATKPNKGKKAGKGKKHKKVARAGKKAKKRGRKGKKAKETNHGAPLTLEARKKMSEFLVKPAQLAFKRQRWPRAVALYQGLVAARGAGSPEAIMLAKAWTVAGQYDEAVKVYTNFIKAGTGTEKQSAFAGKERKRLMNQPNPYQRNFDPGGARGEAIRAFKAGRRLYRRKQWRKALVYYRMGDQLDADLPGFLRELGATYDKLGQRDKKIEFYRAYLIRRPFGKNARVVRAALSKVKGSLGRLTIASAIKCDEVWVNRQPVGRKLPVKKLLVAPGTYKALCVNRKYQIAYFEYAKVQAGKKALLKFNWAVVVNKLENPFGRIAIQDARTGAMMDLGIAQPEYGVIVPSDGRALKMVLTSLDGAKKVTRFPRIPPGAREIIKW